MTKDKSSTRKMRDVLGRRQEYRDSHPRNAPVDYETALTECRQAARRGYRLAKESLTSSEAVIKSVSNSLKQGLSSIGVLSGWRGHRNKHHRNEPVDLETALAECRQAARRGYRLAKKSLTSSKADIKSVSNSLKQGLSSLDDGQARTTDVVEQLQAQLHQVVGELHSLHASSMASLKARREHLDEFSIALFGRTQSGKSTLMEILTDGDGASIGKGAQRTTRDVRSYRWKGLKVTDVPGVAAFEGEEDEELAFQAASEADLVLFLITDDAPQPVEAECLRRVRALGKPILGICNVKDALEDSDDVFLFLKKMQKGFDRKTLDTLVSQFHALADRYNPGYKIRFIYTHLQSRYLSSKKAYREKRDELQYASCFNLVERQIVSEVTGRGRFLRVKSFIDGAVAPMLALSDHLLEFSAENSSSGRVMVDKKRLAADWARAFQSSGQERIDSFVERQIGALRDEIPAFSEDNYDRSDAGARWARFVEHQGLQKGAEQIQGQLQKECQVSLSEIARELEAELKLVGEFAGDRKISMDSIFDTKRAWNWGTGILASGLGIAAVFLASGPLGWAAGAVGVVGVLVSWLFDDREAKARKQRRKLTTKLNLNVDNLERTLRKKLGDWFHQDLLSAQVYVLLNDLSAVTSGLFELADAQRYLAWKLTTQQKAIHRSLLAEALAQLDRRDVEATVLDMARVPGLAIMLLIKPDTTFPGDVRSGLEKLLGERVWFVVDTGNAKSILSQAIGRGCDRGRVSIESKIQVAHVPVGDLDAVGVSRIRLAQQLTELHVIR